MPVTTRRQAAASVSNFKKKGDKKIVESDFDSWDIPESNLRSSVIKTYSKKQPFRTYGTSESKNQSTKKSSKPGDSSVTPQKTKLNEEPLSLPKAPPSSIKTVLPKMSKRSTKTPNIKSSTSKSTQSTLKRTRNQTKLAVESMTTCTRLATQSSETSFGEEDMSLCSVLHKAIENQENRNSTILPNCGNIVQDFVPNEISIIKGLDQNCLLDTVVSKNNERTPKNKPTQTAASVKKVRFHVKTPKNQSNTKRYNLRKTPYRNEKSKNRKCPKTSSPDPNEQISMLHCEISTLLVDDYPNKNDSKNTSSNRITQDTEKLMDFEPIPLQVSENVEERDVTPEACISLKALRREIRPKRRRSILVFQSQTSSAKRRRRLSYNFDEQEVPPCILLDFPVSETRKNSTIWVGKHPHPISIEQLGSFPDDILL